MRDNFDSIKTSGRLLYQYVRGSQLYNTALDGGQSDIDTGGIFIAPLEDSIGTHIHYQDEIASSKHDDVLYELEKYGRMLGTSNSTVMESLFVPEEMMIVKPHKCLEGFFAHKNDFITQRCFKPFTAYAISQIKKCSGLNKLINWDIKERLTPLDFCYTFKNQGSTKIKNWLEYRSMKQEYCGLVNVPNMNDFYAVFYDWGRHFRENNISITRFIDSCFLTHTETNEIVNEMSKPDANKVFLEQQLKESQEQNFAHMVMDMFHLKSEDDVADWFYKHDEPIGYRGITVGLATELRLSSVVKGEMPVCHLSYNEDAYTKHCKDYKLFKDWEKYRNPVRYESNLNKKYDSKNMYHCFRLIQMGIEIANGEGINLKRTYDRQFLLDVRNHKYEYDEIMSMALEKEKEMNEAMKNTSLPKELDIEMLNNLVIEAKKSFFNIS